MRACRVGEKKSEKKWKKIKARKDKKKYGQFLNMLRVKQLKRE